MATYINPVDRLLTANSQLILSDTGSSQILTGTLGDLKVTSAGDLILSPNGVIKNDGYPLSFNSSNVSSGYVVDIDLNSSNIGGLKITNSNSGTTSGYMLYLEDTTLSYISGLYIKTNYVGQSLYVEGGDAEIKLTGNNSFTVSSAAALSGSPSNPTLVLSNITHGPNLIKTMLYIKDFMSSDGTTPAILIDKDSSFASGNNGPFFKIYNQYGKLRFEIDDHTDVFHRTLTVYEEVDDDVDFTNYVRIKHDTTNGYIETNSGDIILKPNSGNLYVGELGSQVKLYVHSGNDNRTVRIWHDTTNAYIESSYGDIVLYPEQNVFNFKEYRSSFSSSGNVSLNINGGNYDNYIWQVGSDYTGSYGYKLKYVGTGSGANNYLEFISDNQGGTDLVVMRFDQDGNIFIPSGSINGLRTTGLLTINANSSGTNGPNIELYGKDHSSRPGCMHLLTYGSSGVFRFNNYDGDWHEWMTISSSLIHLKKATTISTAGHDLKFYVSGSDFYIDASTGTYTSNIVLKPTSGHPVIIHSNAPRLQPQNHKTQDLGVNTVAWDDVYADDFINMSPVSPSAFFDAIKTLKKLRGKKIFDPEFKCAKRQKPHLDTSVMPKDATDYYNLKKKREEYGDTYPDGTSISDPDKNLKSLGVSISNYVSFLAAVCLEQQEKIEELEERIKALGG